MLPAIVFVVNAWVIWRLWFSEYIDQLTSIEGEFIAMATYIQHHWPSYDWQSLWFGGYPVTRTYQPLVHYTVAALASIFGLSPASAFHLFGAFSYSLGGVAFYFLTKTLLDSRVTAFCGGLCFSLFSPSGLLNASVRHDMGGVWNARRLQVLVVYGDLPNLTGLMIGMFAIALLHRALTRHTPASAVSAAVMLAGVPATNWPSTIALIAAIVCYLAALSRSELVNSLRRLTFIGAMGTVFALPFALPSTIVATYENTNIMSGLPTHGPRRWASIIFMIAAVGLVRFIVANYRLPFALRFASLWFTVLAWVVLSSSLAHTAILPQPLRFHIAAEIPLVLAAVVLLWMLCRRYRTSRGWVAVVFLWFCIGQLFHYRRYSHSIIHRLDITKTIEYQESTWFDTHMNGERVAAPGAVQLWMNVFTPTPQMLGCCEQSVLTRENLIAEYVTAAGYQTDAQSADYALLWMKAFAVHAVAIGGPRSREPYRQFQFPTRYHDILPLAWASGDDYIYLIPARVSGLARVVRKQDIVRRAPSNGIDVSELRPFVAALDDVSLPATTWHWNSVNSATIRASLSSDKVIAVALNYHPGWTATVGDRGVPVCSDGLGLIMIEPHCSGLCVVTMRWSPGLEPRIVLGLALVTMMWAVYACVRYRKQAVVTNNSKRNYGVKD